LPLQKAEKGAKSNPPRIPPNLSGECCRMTPLYEGKRKSSRAASDYGSIVGLSKHVSCRANTLALYL
jgi:hypothetical protein